MLYRAFIGRQYLAAPVTVRPYEMHLLPLFPVLAALPSLWALALTLAIRHPICVFVPRAVWVTIYHSPPMKRPHFRRLLEAGSIGVGAPAARSTYDLPRRYPVRASSVYRALALSFAETLSSPSPYLLTRLFSLSILSLLVNPRTLESVNSSEHQDGRSICPIVLEQGIPACSESQQGSLPCVCSCAHACKVHPESPGFL